MTGRQRGSIGLFWFRVRKFWASKGRVIQRSSPI